MALGLAAVAVGAGLSALGSIAGGITSSIAAKRGKEKIEQEQEKNETWYKQRYNESALDRADARRLLTMTENAMRSRTRGAQGRNAVMGATTEQMAAEKNANAQSLASTMSAINAQAQAHKDSIENAYIANRQNYSAQLAQLEQNRAANIAKAVQGVASVGSDIAKAGISGILSGTKA